MLLIIASFQIEIIISLEMFLINLDYLDFKKDLECLFSFQNTFFLFDFLLNNLVHSKYIVRTFSIFNLSILCMLFYHL